MQEGDEVVFIFSGPTSKHGLTEIKERNLHFTVIYFKSVILMMIDMWTPLPTMPFVKSEHSRCRCSYWWCELILLSVFSADSNSPCDWGGRVTSSPSLILSTHTPYCRSKASLKRTHSWMYSYTNTHFPCAAWGGIINSSLLLKLNVGYWNFHSKNMIISAYINSSKA